MTGKVKKRSKVKKSFDKPLLENGMINNLPDDCLMHIFSFLSVKDLQTIEEVCIRWKSLGQRAWCTVRALSLSELNAYKSIFWDVWPLCGRFLTKLQFTLLFDDEPSHKKVICHMAEHCKNLKEVIIRFYGCTERECDYVKDLLDQNRKLRRIKFENVSTVATKLRNRMFEALPNKMSKISLLRFEPGETKRRFTLPLEALSKFQQLKYLRLDDFVIHRPEFKSLENLQNLTTLKLHNNSIDKSTLNDITLFRNLERLDLTRNSNLTNEWFTKVAERCLKLNYLKLKRCERIEKEGLSKLVALPHLEVLILESCNGVTMTKGLRRLCTLKKLTYTNYEGHFSIKSGILPLIQAAPELRFMNLSGTCVTRRLLQAAHKILKTRTNSSKLKIVVPDDIYNGWIAKQIDESPLIVTSSTEYKKSFKAEK